MAASDANRAIVLGISGCSSSGKTTLNRLLRDIFPNAFILHEDDFYRPETELPMKNDLLDWDCVEALNIPQITEALKHIKETGTFPPNVDSKEDQNSVGPCPVPSSTITSLKTLVSTWTSPGHPGHAIFSSPTPPRLCIFDGFLLYTPQLSSIQPLIDIKVFLRVSYEKAKARREARSGYVTLEGFWEDPPGYVDQIVWPNYVKYHEWMFENGDVEGKLKEEVVGREGIEVQGERGLDVGMETTLRWAVELVMRRLEEMYA